MPCIIYERKNKASTLIRIDDRLTGISSRARSIAVYFETLLVTEGLSCVTGVDIEIWGSAAGGELHEWICTQKRHGFIYTCRHDPFTSDRPKGGETNAEG
jgi:hypothetical protein